jgi:HNH endonuclease
MPRIPKALRTRIIAVADGRCEYCLTLQELTLATFHLDHILPRSAGGKTAFENLCFSCPLCNQFKQGLWRARNPETGRLVRLFNPRRDRWRTHFRWSDDGIQIIGLTARGRATVAALRLNNPIALRARSFWIASGRHPPPAESGTQ